MNYLKILQDAGFAVRWGTVLVGWIGPPQFPRLVEAQDVVSFAIDQISDEQIGSDKDILELAGLIGTEYDEIPAYLRRLAAREKFKFDWELRKWRFILLKQALDGLPDDPIYGPIRLTEFWSKFDFPADSPHIVQGRGNDIEPQDYYAPETFNVLLKRHYRWLQEEELKLKEGDSST
jgi:hypothetical protein